MADEVLSPNQLSQRLYDSLRQIGALSPAGVWPDYMRIFAQRAGVNIDGSPIAPSDNSDLPAAPTETGEQYGPPSPPGAPTVTPSPSTRAATARASSSSALPLPPPAPPEAPQAQPTQDQTQSPTETRNPSMDRLAQFGFAMAASRNPSLFGQIGDAGLAMIAGDRERRQDATRQQIADTEQEYRRAQVELARAEAQFNQNPDSPRNVALLAQARYHMAMAERAARTPVGGAGGGGGPMVPLVDNEGNLTFFQPRSGNVIRAPEGLRQPGQLSRDEALVQRDITTFGNMNRNNPQYMVDPAALTRDAEAYAARRRAERMGAGGGTTAAPDAQTPNRIRIPFTP